MTAGINTPILVLHPQADNLDLLVKNCLEPNIYNTYILDAFLSIASSHSLNNYPIHIKFNTGLNRLGFNENDVEILGSKLKNNSSVKIESIFSHLAASEDENEEEFTLSQISSFEKISTQFNQVFGFLPNRHMTNTSGILNYPQAHYDMVRLGIGLFGFGNSKKETENLKNTLTLSSIISQIHLVKKGDSVGYNRDFFSVKPMKIATIPIGHADGVSRKLGNGIGHVKINNQKAIIIGNVCMDMIMADISDIKCKEGDHVIIFDNQEMVEEMALNSGTISYELLTALSQRIRRIILK